MGVCADDGEELFDGVTTAEDMNHVKKSKEEEAMKLPTLSPDHAEEMIEAAKKLGVFTAMQVCLHVYMCARAYVPRR